MKLRLVHIGFVLGFLCAWGCAALGVRLWPFMIGYCIGVGFIEGISYLSKKYD